MTGNPTGALDELGALLALERQAELDAFRDERASLSLAERVSRGLTWTDFEATDERWGLGGRLLVTLARAQQAPIEGMIGSGDLVEVSPRRSVDGEAVRGIVARRERSSLEIAFDRPPPDRIREGRVLIDRVPNEVTFQRAAEAIARVRAMERGASRRRRDVLLGEAAPRWEPIAPWIASRPLNPEQEEAVARALSARDVFLVHGPPGTGKSTVLAEVAVQAVRRGERVLATAASNAAVDHLLELVLEAGLKGVRIGHPARVADHLVSRTLDLMVEAHPAQRAAREILDEAHELLGYSRKQRARGRSRERFANARDARAQASRLFAEARRLQRQATRGVLDGADVLCATCASLPSAELRGYEFDLALFDEATQAIAPISFLPFLQASRVVFAGDHRQLPPTVISLEAARGGLAQSLFERLLVQHGDEIRVMLREQYRMNEAIMGFPSAEMYEGELRAHPAVAAHTLGDLLEASEFDARPVIFLDTAGKGFEEEAGPGTESLMNRGEAELCLARAGALVGAGVDPQDVAVIAPYRAQVTLLRTRAAARGLPERVEIDSVDAFQGREKEAVLVSLTRSNDRGEIGFLGEVRRMNVALTRAKRHLFVVGDSATLTRHPFYESFVEYAQGVGGYTSAWEWPEA